MNTRISSRDIPMPTSIRLTPEIEERLNFLAAQTGRSKAFYLREIIERGLDDMEDYFLSADVLERVRKGKEKIRSSAEIKKDPGLED
jgi:RHH-type rel operon transcriptional repressor/antitoxin RelB